MIKYRIKIVSGLNKRWSNHVAVFNFTASLLKKVSILPSTTSKRNPSSFCPETKKSQFYGNGKSFEIAINFQVPAPWGHRWTYLIFIQEDPNLRNSGRIEIEGDKQILSIKNDCDLNLHHIKF